MGQMTSALAGCRWDVNLDDLSAGCGKRKSQGTFRWALGFLEQVWPFWRPVLSVGPCVRRDLDCDRLRSPPDRAPRMRFLAR